MKKRISKETTGRAKIAVAWDKSSSHGLDVNRRSPSFTNIVTSAFFQKRADGTWFPRYQNSYRLEPYKKFNVEVVDEIIKTVMKARLSTVTAYEPEEASNISMKITNEVLRALMKKDYDRCKLIVQASVMQNSFQGTNVSLGCLWDIERDNYSHHVFENNHIYAWCAVIGLYYE